MYSAEPGTRASSCVGDVLHELGLVLCPSLLGLAGAAKAVGAAGRRMHVLGLHGGRASGGGEGGVRSRGTQCIRVKFHLRQNLIWQKATGTDGRHLILRPREEAVSLASRLGRSRNGLTCECSVARLLQPCERGGLACLRTS